MAQRTATIASSVGLHARPAALFVEAAGDTGLDVEIARPGEDPVDATSILGVMALGAKYGEEVVLTADGDGADAALDKLVALLSRDLDAEDHDRRINGDTARHRGQRRLGLRPGRQGGTGRAASRERAGHN